MTDRSIENTKEEEKKTQNTVEQSRQNAQLHSMKHLNQGITTCIPSCHVGFPRIVHKRIKARQTSQK